MSDKKLTQLTELTTVADDDFMYITDTSTGQSAKAQAKNIRGIPRTAAEISAGVTPTNYQYEPGNVLRYGTNTTPGTTDMSTAVANAALVGDMFVPDEVFLTDGFTTSFSVTGPGTLKRKTGDTGDFITTGAAGVRIGCVIDGDDVAGNNIQISHDDCYILPEAVIKNGFVNGVRHSLGNNVTIKGRYFDCRQTHVQIIVSTADILGLYIDVDVDAVTLGLSNLNGGVKVHGNATYRVDQPTINARVRLLQSTSSPANAVCIETLTNVPGAKVSGTAIGGSIGCTLNGSPGAFADVVATGQDSIGLEITNGSHGATMTGISRGDTVNPNNNVLVDSSDDVSVDVYGEDALVSCLYLNITDGARVSGTFRSTAANTYIRLLTVTDVDLVGIQGIGSVTRAIALDTAAEDVRVIGGRFAGITNFLQTAITSNRISVSGGCRIENSGAFVGGGGSLPGMTMTADCVVDTLPYGSGAKHVRILDFVSQAGPSLLDLTRAGTPEGSITAKIGSTCRRDDGGAGTSLYVKESGTGSAGWVGK